MSTTAHTSVPWTVRVGQLTVVAVVTMAIGSIGLGVFNWMTGAEEWRPGSHLDSVMLSSAVVANVLAMGVLGLLSRPIAYPVSRGRIALGYSLIATALILLVLRVLRG